MSRITPFSEFLTAHKANGRTPTHTRIANKDLGIYGGAYCIPEEDENEFYKLYFERVIDKEYDEYLTEAQLKEGGPMAVDLDFRFPPDVTERQYTADHVTDIISTYTNQLAEFFELGTNKFKVFVFEKLTPNTTSRKETKDGIHLVFGMQVPHKIQVEIRRKLLEKEWFKDIIDIPTVNSWNEVLDEGITRGCTNWQLYGSKKPGYEPYQLTRIVEVSAEDYDEIDAEEFDDWRKLCVRYRGNSKFELKAKYASLLEDTPRPVVRAAQSGPLTEMETDKFTDLLFNVIRNEYDQSGGKKINMANNYYFRVCAALKSNGYPIEVFERFTNLLPGKTPTDTHIKMWDKLKPEKHFDIHCLQNIAKDVNPAGYKEWLNKWRRADVAALLRGIEKRTMTSGMLADIFKAKYGSEWMANGGNLYHYNGVYWESGARSGAALFEAVERDLVNTLKKYAETLPKLTQDDMKTYGDFYRSIAKITSRKVRKDIIDDIKEKIISFVQFDENPCLVAFTNRIYDAKLGEFVDSNPEQYIATTTGYDWVEPTAEQIGELKNMISMILPIEGVREYYLSALSTGFIGALVQHMFILTGVGGNGKSMLDDLMLEATGGYGYKAPSKMLQDEIKMGPNPQIYALHRKRFVLAQEPRESKKICTTTMKELTGGAKMNARDLYGDSNDCQIQLLMSLFVEANRLPPLDETGEAVARRNRVFQFLSRFVDACKLKDFEGIPNVYMKDERFVCQQWRNSARCTLVKMLMPYMKTFILSGNKLPAVPQEVEDASSDYMKRSDSIYGWFEETYKPEPESFVYLSDMYDEYKCSENWQYMAKSKQREMTRKKFIEELEQNLFIKQCIKPRDTYIKLKNQAEKIKLTKPAIYGWALCEPETSNDGATTCVL